MGRYVGVVLCLWCCTSFRFSLMFVASWVVVFVMCIVLYVVRATCCLFVLSLCGVGTSSRFAADACHASLYDVRLICCGM